MARKLLMHATNAGASVYFADCGLRNAKTGTPVLVGRVSLMTASDAPGRKASDDMLAAQHLRAAIFVVERAAVELLQHPLGAKGAYILDVGNYPTKEMTRFTHRFWDDDGPGDQRHPAAIGPHLPGHDRLTGLAVLKEALRMLERHYPETLHRVYFYRPSVTFRAIFAIFRLWVPKSTRQRFVLVKPGEEERHFFAPDGCGLDRNLAPAELGGFGPSLDGDRFIMRSIASYDSSALLPAQTAA
jgi:hypothetical protein